MGKEWCGRLVLTCWTMTTSSESSCSESKNLRKELCFDSWQAPLIVFCKLAQIHDLLVFSVATRYSSLENDVLNDVQYVKYVNLFVSTIV